jgi:RNA 2',3'-cyclic 3'-phosphodiesterase
VSRVRTFIGIDPGKTIRDRIVALQESLARSGSEVKWVEPDNLHVTLLFLGEVDLLDVPPLCQAVTAATAQHSAFAMSIETAGCFPNPRRPRILWVGVGEGAQEVVALHNSLEPPLLELGCYRREERQYTPHVTLGRVKSDRPTDKLAMALAKRAGWKGGETMVREIHVLSSELTRQGPVYSVLSRVKLG